MRPRYLLLIFAILFAALIALYANGYWVYMYSASPGFTTKEQAETFFKQVPECRGYSFVLSDDRALDGGVTKLCVGKLIPKE